MAWIDSKACRQLRWLYKGIRNLIDHMPLGQTVALTGWLRPNENSTGRRFNIGAPTAIISLAFVYFLYGRVRLIKAAWVTMPECDTDEDLLTT